MKKSPIFYKFIIIIIVAIASFTSCKKVPVVNDLTTSHSDTTAAEPDSSYFHIAAYYPFNDSGLDYSGHAINLSFANISSAADRNGNADQAYYFNGVNSSAHADNPDVSLYRSNFTMNVWINLDSYGGAFGSAIMGRRGIGPNNGWLLTVTNASQGNASKSGLLCFMSGSTDKYAVDTTVLNLHRWYMVTVMYDYAAQKCSFFVDGDLKNVVSNINAQTQRVIADFYVGRDNPLNTADGYFFNGYMDELRIFNRLASNYEIKKLKAKTD